MINWNGFLLMLFGLLVCSLLGGCDLLDNALTQLCPAEIVCPECVTEDALFWVDADGGFHGDLSIGDFLNGEN